MKVNNEKKLNFQMLFGIKKDIMLHLKKLLMMLFQLNGKMVMIKL